jgi:hypothetical protein
MFEQGRAGVYVIAPSARPPDGLARGPGPSDLAPGFVTMLGNESLTSASDAAFFMTTL